MISVIVCTYNQQSTIGRTLESILRQKCHMPFEIIIGNDASTDGTESVGREYAERYPQTIRLFNNEKNKGLIDNYYDCLLETRGEFVSEIAGDDFWTDDQKLEKELRILEENPDVALVHTNWQYFDEASSKNSPSPVKRFTKPLTDGKEMLEAIITQTHSPVIHMCTAMYRKDIVIKAYKNDTYLFRNKDFGCEDLQVCFMCAQEGEIAYIDDVTLSYSINNNSISGNDDFARQFDFVRKTTSLSRYLTNKYFHNTYATDAFFGKRLFAMSMHAFRAHSVEMRDKVRECVKEWEMKLPLKSRIVDFVMSNNALWRMALAFRAPFIYLKKKLR